MTTTLLDCLKQKTLNFTRLFKTITMQKANLDGFYGVITLILIKMLFRQKIPLMLKSLFSYCGAFNYVNTNIKHLELKIIQIIIRGCDTTQNGLKK